MSSQVDLKSLAVRRDATPKHRRRHWLTRYALPAALVFGFLGLVAYAVRERFDPPRAVTVIPVMTTRSTAAATDEPLFQAAGWIEPRPGPTLVTALTEGNVDELLVVDGQDVKVGDAVARLNSADAKLAADAAESDVLLREAELAAANAAVVATSERFERPTHLQVELAEADAAMAKAETEQANLPNLRRVADARLHQARQDVELKRQGAVAATVLARAEADAEVAAAAVDELRVKAERLPTEIAAQARKRDALRDRLERRTDERRQLAEAEAAVRANDAKVRQARGALDVARLRLERCTVRTPAAGRVMSLSARPGAHVSGGHDSGIVAQLYDPKSVQARADVRLEDVGRVESGMRVRIESAAIPGKAIVGTVLLVTSQADMQKNTLPVKVALPDPPPQLRPDMLVRVTFLAPPRPVAASASTAQRLLVPRTLVDGSGASARIWVADRVTGRAVARTVALGPINGDLVEVVSGLDPSDKLITGNREGLKDGQRIVVTGEDEALGIK